jgi:ferrous iron transport protein A
MMHMILNSNKSMTTLNALLPDETAEVCALIGGRGLVSRLAALGFIPGAAIRVLQARNGGPLVVLVRDTRVALGRGEAMKVLVTRSEEDHGGRTV